MIHPSLAQWAKQVGSSAKTVKGQRRAITASFKPVHKGRLIDGPLSARDAVAANQYRASHQRQRQERWAAQHPLVLASDPPARPATSSRRHCWRKRTRMTRRKTLERIGERATAIRHNGDTPDVQRVKLRDMVEEETQDGTMFSQDEVEQLITRALEIHEALMEKDDTTP